MSNRWGVVVDEVRMLAVGKGDTDLWFRWRKHAEQSGRPPEVIDVGYTPAGETVWVECADHDTALWFEGWLLTLGIPQAAVKVTARRPKPRGESL